VGNDEIPGHSKTDARFLENLRVGLLDDMLALEATEALLRDALLVDGNVVGTLANLRIQQQLLLATFIAIVIAVVSLVLTLHH
jgi:hypothetical protein